MKKIYLFVAFFLCYLALSAQNNSNNGFGVQSSFCRPFIADINSVVCKFNHGFGTAQKEYDLSKSDQNYRFYSFTNLGVDFPYFSKNFSRKKFGLAFSMPIHFETWLDYFEPTTSPIINTDFNVAFLEIKFIQRFDYNNFIKNFSLKFIPFYHQSTHLGDEIMIYRINEGYPLSRVNVSYNYAELSVWINDPDTIQGYNSSVRFGFMQLHKPSKGWYSSMRAIEGDTSLAVKSKNSSEFYIQYQIQAGKYFLSGKKLQNIFSIELRNRVLYSYPVYVYDQNNLWTSKTITEKRIWNVNIFWGWRIKNLDSKLYNYLGFGFNYYRGINPHGQFRNYENYQFFGFSLIME